jgi:predicted NBD/HSP70 family sugar kinase
MPKVANQWLQEILRLLYKRRAATRTDIIQATGLNRASLSHALRLLLDRGTVLKIGERQSNGGRPSDVLTLNPEAGYFAAVDLEGRRIRFALSNFVGDIRCRWEEDFEEGEPVRVDKLTTGVSRVLRDLNDDQRARLVALGVSYPGLLDPQGRLTAFNLGWRKFPFLTELHEALHLAIFAEHDKHSCVLAERWLGSAQDYRHGLFVIVERGIGVGVFLDGMPVDGWRGMVGELGHCIVDPDADDLCGCGRRGCLESIASSVNIVRQYRERVGTADGHLRVTDVFERARRGDPAAKAVLDRAGKALGRALSYAIQFLNPEIIIFGGDIISGEDVLLPIVKEEIARCTLPEVLSGVKITLSSLGLDIRLRGAVSMAFRASLQDPKLLEKMCAPVLTERQQRESRSLDRGTGAGEEPLFTARLTS